MLLLVLVRQGVGVGAQLDDDVLLTVLRVAPQGDGHFGHEGASLVAGALAFGVTC